MKDKFLEACKNRGIDFGFLKIYGTVNRSDVVFKQIGKKILAEVITEFTDKGMRYSEINNETICHYLDSKTWSTGIKIIYERSEYEQ